MSDIQQLNDDLDKLSELRATIADRTKDIKKEEAVLLAPIKIKKDALAKMAEDYEKLREEVMFQLHANQMEKWQNKKITAYIVEKPKVGIRDHLKVANWLTNNGFNTDEYAKPFEIDTQRIAPLQLERLKEDGEIIDGMEFEVQEILTVRDRSEK